MSKRSSTNSNNKSVTTNRSKKQVVTFADHDDSDEEDEEDVEDEDNEDNEDKNEENDDEETTGSSVEGENESITDNTARKGRRPNRSSSNNEGMKLCVAPTFQLPSSLTNDDSGSRHSHTPNTKNSMEEDRYELWTVRIPSSVNVQELHRSTIPKHTAFPKPNQKLDDTDSTNAPIITTTTSRDTTSTASNINSGSISRSSTTMQYQFHLGQPTENESFRLLTTDRTDPSSSHILVPSTKPFQKHFNVVLVPTDNNSTSSSNVPNSAVGTPSQTSVPIEVQPLRHAYAPIPQKTGLKRRWKPFGTCSTGSFHISQNNGSFDDKSSAQRNRKETTEHHYQTNGHHKDISTTTNCQSKSSSDTASHHSVTTTSVAIKLEEGNNCVLDDTLTRNGITTATAIKMEEDGPTEGTQTKAKRKYNATDDDELHKLAKAEKKAMKKERKREKKLKKETSER
jgi:DNA-directed RNA polymerase I subunit RPA34.5